MRLRVEVRLCHDIEVHAVMMLALLTFVVPSAPAGAAQPQDSSQSLKSKDQPAKKPAVKLGLALNDPRAYQGYTLVSPLMFKKSYLIDMQGKVVNTWNTTCDPATCAYLLENGNLLRPGSLGDETKPFGGGPGAGGRVQEFTWDGKLVWDFKLYNDKQLPHHDVTRLPNGNVLMIVWDKKTREEAVAAGRVPSMVGTYLLPDSLVEVKPTGKTGGEIVWEWHLWDHLIQDRDSTRANYGKVAEHPELVDINFGQDIVGQVVAKKGGLDKLKGIGYVGANTGKGKGPNADWTHVNGVAYNADLDQVVISIHSFSEIWIIDHSTTTAEAAGHKGGRSGKGGDLLYRWGNPRAYQTGTKKDQRLFAQHNAHWIPKGLPGEGHLLVFNNGNNRPDGSYSSVDEIVLPADDKGQYAHKTGTAFGPEKAVWSYSAPKKSDFYSFFISGAQRLPDGHTLICSGANGTVFEVTPQKEIVWKYLNPVQGMRGFPFKGPGGKGPGKGPDGKGPPDKGPGFAGFGKFPGPPQPGQVLPPFLQDILKLNDEQKKEVDKFQQGVGLKLGKILTSEQNKQLKEAKPGFGPGGFGAPPQPGQIMSPFLQAKLKLEDDQKKRLGELQKETDAKLNSILVDDQKKQLKAMRAGPGPGMFGGPGGLPGFPPFGPPGGGALFRAYRYAADYPGLAGRSLVAGKTIEQLQSKEQPKDPKSKQAR
jgi:hypothetical protein